MLLPQDGHMERGRTMDFPMGQAIDTYVQEASDAKAEKKGIKVK